MKNVSSSLQKCTAIIINYDVLVNDQELKGLHKKIRENEHSMERMEMYQKQFAARVEELQKDRIKSARKRSDERRRKMAMWRHHKPMKSPRSRSAVKDKTFEPYVFGDLTKKRYDSDGSETTRPS
jgi:G3E family GTPase